MPCDDYGNGLVICSTPITVVRVEDAGVKWCFICRKRVPFRDELHDPGPESYYEPTWHRYCENGHFDGDVFPGCSRWNG